MCVECGRSGRSGEYVRQRATTEAKVDAKRIVKVGVLVGREGGGELQSKRRGCLS